MDNRSFTDVGGTPGGIGEFLIGFVMTCIGGYLISNQVSVVGSYWSFYGANTFGVTLVPMLLGVAILFWNGKSVIGWVLAAAGAALHPCGCDREYAHLFSANDLVQHHGDADPIGRRPRIDRALNRKS